LAERGDDGPAKSWAWRQKNWRWQSWRWDWLREKLRLKAKGEHLPACLKPAKSQQGVVLRCTKLGCKLALGLVLFVAAASGILATRLAIAPVSIKGLGPQIAQSLGERFGRGLQFSFGNVEIAREGYSPTVAVGGLSIKDSSGHVVLTAPRAEVSVGLLPLLFGDVKPKRLEIYDVEVQLTLRPDGSLAMPASANSDETVGLTQPLAAPPGFAAISPRQEGTATNPPPALPVKPRALLVKQMATTLRLLIDSLTDSESPAAAIDRLGISRGKLTVLDETAGQTLVFNGVNLEFGKAWEGTRFDLSVDGPNGRWSISGAANGKPGAQRGLKITLENLSLDEILLATGTRTIGADFDMPLSAKLGIRLHEDGAISEAAGRFEFGAGYLRFENPDDEPLMVDKIDGGFHWDSRARRIVIEPSRLAAGATHFAILGAVVLPVHEGDPWAVALSNAETGIAAPDRPGEESVAIDRLSLTGRLFLQKKMLSIDRFTFSGPKCGLALAGSVDWVNGPHVRLGASISPTPVRAVLRLWPSFLAPPIRSYLLPRVHEGILRKGTMRIDFDASDMDAMMRERPPGDEKSAVDFELSGADLEFLSGVPPLRGISGTGHISGRTATFKANHAELDAGDSQVLMVPEGSFHLADSGLKPTPAIVEAKVSASVGAVGKLLSYEALKPFANLPLDPATLRGHAEGMLEIDLKLGPNMGPDDVSHKINADVTDFYADRLIGSARLEAATLNVVADASGLRTSGQGIMFGVPVAIAMTRLPDKAAEASIVMTLDDGARARMGFGAIPGLSGLIGAKLSAPIGTGENPKAHVDLDLDQANIDIAGVSKPPGSPGKATFALNVTDTGALLDQLVIDAGSIQARGSANLGADFSLLAARFPQARLSSGDEMAIEATRAGETMKVNVQARIIDARPFLKSLIFNSPNPRAPANGADEHRDTGPIKEIEYDVVAGTLTGYNKIIVNGVELTYAKRGDQLQKFTFAGTVDGRTISSNLTGTGSSPQLNIVSEDAGSLLSFLDLYTHMQHGRLIAGMRLSPDTLAGALVIDDFLLRDEPGLRRLVLEGAPPADSKIDANAISFNKLQVRFRRDGSQLELSEGTMHGEAIGLNVEGALDYVHDRVDMSGTFVPVYAFNNLFAKIPVVGFILAGGANGGLFGINYRITGKASAPTLSINPLSAIAPGIFREIFGVTDIDPLHPR